VVEGRIPTEIWSALQRALRYRDPKAHFSWRGKHGQDDGLRELFVQEPGQGRWVFPAGLFDRAMKAIRDTGMRIRVPVTSRIQRLETAVQPSDPLPDGTTLYPEQQIAVAAAVAKQRGIWALTVNAGKTECAAWLAHAYENYRVLYLVNSREAMNLDDENSIAARLQRRLQRRIGIFGAGRRSGLTRGLTLAMVQSLRSRAQTDEVHDLLGGTEVLIIDEADTISPPTWFPILGNCPAPMRIAMSGTIREHWAPIIAEAFTGPIIAEIKDQELVELGRSAAPVILMPYVAAAVHDSKKFDELYMPGIVENAARNKVIADAVAWWAERKLRALILYFRLEHGELLARELESRGLRFSLLHGGSPPHEITRSKSALTDRRLDCLVASRIFDRNVNLPEIELVVNAASWKSRQATIQKLGRGLRKKLEGLNQVIVVDPYDLGTKILKRHAEARRRAYQRRGFKVQLGQLEELLATL
jgi:superfamily II DNA or RNA helicase